MPKRALKRYSAYFRGWCQAFGEHESIEADDNDRFWLIADGQVGLVLPQPHIKLLYREVLLHERVPPVTFSEQSVQVGSLNIPFHQASGKQVMKAMHQLMDSGLEMHVFVTSHLLYGDGSKVFTFSNKKPISIIYKEIGTMNLKLQLPRL